MNLYTLTSRIQAAALHATYTSAWDRGRVYNHSTMFIKCVCKIYICIYIYIYIDMYVYMCIYIYTPVYGRWENMRQLFLSFEGRIGTKDTRRPPHASPWWSRIIYRVAWLILGLASGCLLTPEICLLPSLLLHRILLLSIIPSLYSLLRVT